jgi:hypothetical protein
MAAVDVFEQAIDDLIEERDCYHEQLQEALKAITQGRIAFDDGQDMTDWYVSTAELQATIESFLAEQEATDADA